MHSRGEDLALGAFLAIITTSVVLWMNIFSIVALLRKTDIISAFFNRTNSIALGIVLIVLDYFLLMHNKKYTTIVDLFKDESNTRRSIGSILVLVYIILSLTFFICVALYRPGIL